MTQCRLSVTSWTLLFLKMKQERYASYDSGDGKTFEKGQLDMEQLAGITAELGEPKQISGKQELYESIINRYI